MEIKGHFFFAHFQMVDSILGGVVEYSIITWGVWENRKRRAFPWALSERGTTMPEIKTRVGLTGNALKLIALAAMTLDHIGLMLLPQYPFLRTIGRLAFPIFAYMIAEGCTYTHNKRKYFLRVFGLGVVCQIGYFLAERSVYQCIMITFSMSVALICLLEWREKQANKILGNMALLWAFFGVGFVCGILPMLLKNTDFGVDYGIFGVCLPALIWIGKTKGQKLTFLTLGLTLLIMHYGPFLLFSLMTIPLLALYNGERGKYAIGKLFYIYYPLHLVVIYLIGMVLKI